MTLKSGGERPYMDAPNLARLSALDGVQGKIAPVHPDFCCGACRCGWRQLDLPVVVVGRGGLSGADDN
jgi:hypothetical protein